MQGRLPAQLSHSAGTRIIGANFHIAQTVVIVSKRNPAALDAASGLIRRLKQNVTVVVCLRRHGMEDAVIPPEP